MNPSPFFLKPCVFIEFDSTFVGWIHEETSSGAPFLPGSVQGVFHEVRAMPFSPLLRYYANPQVKTQILKVGHIYPEPEVFPSALEDESSPRLGEGVMDKLFHGFLPVIC